MAASTHDDFAISIWEGRLPIHLTLASPSVSSPTIPPPVHVLVSRQTYLHVGMAKAVQRLYQFAPTISFSPTLLQVSEPVPGVGSSVDEETVEKQTSLPQPKNALPQNPPFVYPLCWFEDEDSGLAVRWHIFAGVLFDLKPNKTLPWRLKLHFTNYPSHQILPLEDGKTMDAVQSIYKHSLKQAMTLASGNSKSAMNLTKESHGLLWEAITSTNFRLYRRVDLIPETVQTVPVRLYLNNSHPPIQRRIQLSEDSQAPSLGELLCQWLPEYGVVEAENAVALNDMVQCAVVCGIEPALSISVLELWKGCCHPDLFLYVAVLLAKP